MEGPFRTPPKGDEEFDPEKHVKVDEKSWVRKSAFETAKKAEAEASRRNVVIEEPNWFFRLFGKTNKENYHSILQEEALETELKDLSYVHKINHDNPRIAKNPTTEIFGTYNGYEIDLNSDDGYKAKINGVETTKDDAKKIWKKIDGLLNQKYKNEQQRKNTNDKLKTKKPVLEILGLLPQRPDKELLETKEPKQLPEKTEE